MRAAIRMLNHSAASDTELLLLPTYDLMPSHLMCCILVTLRKTTNDVITRILTLAFAVVLVRNFRLK